MRFSEQNEQSQTEQDEKHEGKREAKGNDDANAALILDLIDRRRSVGGLHVHTSPS
jgi:hypothetical protein